MSGGERSLDVLLQTMDPVHVPGTFRFVTHTWPRPVPRALLDRAHASVRENGVLSLVVRIDDWPIGQRDEFELKNALSWSSTSLGWITLTVRLTCSLQSTLCTCS